MHINVLRLAWREGSVPGACVGEAGDLMLSLRSQDCDLGSVFRTN